MTTKIIVSDRYSATGTPRPDPATVCRGHCEGMGFYPKRVRCRKRGCGLCANTGLNGYHFVKCGECNGTGKRRGARRKS